MRPFSLLIKPSGPDCNLACAYCFYAEKTCIFGEGKHRMSDDVLDTLVRSYMGLNFRQSSFAWQGGEPTLMGLDFFKKVVSLQQQYGKSGQAVTNALQTNAVLLDDEWCQFLHEYKFLVGISLDGPKEFHDHYRKDRGGRGTFDRVMAAIERCRKHRVEFNILVLLNQLNVRHPDTIFDFFQNLGIRFLQFVPCVETDPQTGEVMDFSITPEQYGEFLCRVFDRWYEYGPQRISIRMFDSILSYMLHSRHTICTFSQRCNDYIVVEHNGDAFCCDFFVEPEYCLGNIMETPIEELAVNTIKRTFSSQKKRLHNKCLVCRHNAICRGGCLKDRIVLHDDFTHPSYFCQSYKTFFDHSLGRFMQMAAELANR